MKILQKVQGIALIQVLIISIILTMLGIYINQTVRAQISIVTMMQSSFELNLQLENAEAEILHTLLTHKSYKKTDSETPLVQRWNFHSQPFFLNQSTQIKFQDLSGLISLNIIDNTLARSLFYELGHDGHEVRTFLDSLADWKDKDDLKRLNGAEDDYYGYLKQSGPRNAYLQTVSEVLSIQQGNLLTNEQWQRFFSKEVVSNFNPLNAPDLLLKAFLANDRAYEEVINLRNAGLLTSYNFYETTSVEQDEYISFGTSRLLKVTIMVNGKNNKLSKQFIVDLRPRTSSRPISISDITWNEM